MAKKQSIIARLRKRWLVQRLMDLRLTVSGLLLLMVLTAWGTLFQKTHGLWAAQERFFYSWFVTVDAFPVAPGGRLLLWIMFANLLAATIFRLRYKLLNIGQILIHWGLLVMMVGSFVTYHYAVESTVPLHEGEATNLSQDYRAWELSVWEAQAGNSQQVYAFDATMLERDIPLEIPELGVVVTAKAYHENTRPAPAGTIHAQNSVGEQQTLMAVEGAKDPQRNLPGGLFRVVAGDQQADVILFGADTAPIEVTFGGKKISFQLRHRRYVLPFVISLTDFVKKEHPGTSMPSSYESTVELRYGEIDRPVRIFMNNPLRHRNFTFYQASFANTEMGEQSVFAVVENVGRLLPYISSGIVFAGLLVHFLVMFAMRRDPKVKRKMEA